MLKVATMATMHDDDDNEYYDLLSILLATNCQSAEVDQFDEFNDSSSRHGRLVLGTIHGSFSASISAMSRCIGGLNAASRDPRHTFTTHS